MTRNRNPRPARIRALREFVGMSQTAAAALIHCSLRTWQQWESGDRRMHPAMWELWLIKTRRKRARPLTP